MRSVADDLRARDREALRALSPAARVTLALALGARDLDAFRFAQTPPLSREEAAHRLARRRQASRRPARCLEEPVG